MVFEENNPGFWIPEQEGDAVTGFLIKSESDVGSNKSMLYHLDVEGKPTSVWGSTILDQRMVGVNVGDKIRITFKGLGEKKSGKNAPKIFKVEVDRESSEDPVKEEVVIPAE